MNKVWINGTILTDPVFKFVIREGHISSVAFFKLQESVSEASSRKYYLASEASKNNRINPNNIRAHTEKFESNKNISKINKKDEPQIFTVYAENEKADQIYRKIKKSRKIVISGELTLAKKSKNHNQRCAILLENFYYY